MKKESAMSKNDPAQGLVADPKALGRKLPTPKPLSAAGVKKQAQPALNARDKQFSKVRPPQKTAGDHNPRDWRIG
jgi:hypothetical protein